jgi:O-methyltransferase domain/Dimerisation domain
MRAAGPDRTLAPDRATEGRTMSNQTRPAAVLLRELIDGYQVTQAIHAAATLGIADLLVDGPKASDELAAAVDVHPRALYRLLRALATVGVFQEEDGHRFGLTPLAECLRSDAPDSLRGWASYIGRPHYWQAWAGLADSVRTGENAFRLVHGVRVWEYRAAHPAESAFFDRAMTDLSRRATRSVVDAYDFGRFGTVVDVGGGQGALLAGLLGEYPALRGVLFDQPHVVTAAERTIRQAGVLDRCAVVGGSFFESVPTGGDAYLLKGVLQDWDDDRSKIILCNCRRAVPATGSLLVIEQQMGPPNEGRAGKFSDLNMLVSPGGENRTLDEYRSLFAAADFALVGAAPTSTGLVVIEAVPV